MMCLGLQATCKQIVIVIVLLKAGCDLDPRCICLGLLQLASRAEGQRVQRGWVVNVTNVQAGTHRLIES